MSVMKNCWDVLILFLIPIGGGIPAGVILAHSRSIDWPIIMFVYLISDIILACIFEPIMLIFIKFGKKIQFFARISEAIKLMIKKTMSHYGNKSGVFTLIMIAFGVDPMTGRGVALVAGHGFIIGWMIAIAGDMIYFTLIMASTLWLNSILGDGTWTTIIIFALMILIPKLFNREISDQAALSDSKK